MPAPLTWPLIPDPVASTALLPGSSAATGASAERGQLAFLGYGLLRPFQRDAKRDFANGGGRRLLSARIGQILGTKADTTASPGELPWRTDFGSRLHILRHRNNTEALAELARVIIVEALARWERNVIVTAVEALELGEPRQLVLRVGYRLVDQSGAALAEDTTSIPLR